VGSVELDARISARSLSDNQVFGAPEWWQDQLPENVCEVAGQHEKMQLHVVVHEIMARHFTEVFGGLPNDKKQQALQRVTSTITVNRPTCKVTKSRAENFETAPLRKKCIPFNLGLYVKSSFSRTLVIETRGGLASIF
jgi:hypothetical protein